MGRLRLEVSPTRLPAGQTWGQFPQQQVALRVWVTGGACMISGPDWMGICPRETVCGLSECKGGQLPKVLPWQPTQHPSIRKSS